MDVMNRLYTPSFGFSRQIHDLCHWAKAHIPQRHAARKRYDSLKLGQIPDPAIGKFDSPAPTEPFPVDWA